MNSLTVFEPLRKSERKKRNQYKNENNKETSCPRYTKYNIIVYIITQACKLLSQINNKIFKT